MSALPARVPASAFTSWRNRSARDSEPSCCSRTPPCSTDDTCLSAERLRPNFSISHLREAIKSLDTKMAALMVERRELESHLEQAVRLQSPVSRIPSELLSNIFIMGVLGMGDENPVMLSTLMLVCRYWADVALNTPVLWAKVIVSPHHSVERARRRIERSKSYPIDVVIDFGPRIVDYNMSVTDQVVRAMDLVRPALWRTRSLFLSVPNRPQAHVALVRCQENAPLLESLTVRVFHSMQEDNYLSLPLPLFKGHTPRLRSCSFTSFNFGWDKRLLSRLRCLNLGGYFNSSAPSAHTLLEILAQCPELEELSLRNMSSVDSDIRATHSEDVDPPPLSRTVHLRHLTKATFYYAGIARTRQILSQVRFPNLESISLCYLENVTPIISILHSQALTRLPLRHLRVETCLLNEMKFVSLLRKLPSLTNLELIDMEDASSNFLKALSSAQPWACPRLESLTIDGCTSLDWESLRTFVESRLPSTYSRYHTSPNSISSSASAAAAAQARSKAHQARNSAASTLLAPSRLLEIDVTRCHQISKEMVQWLRMYVASVKCEPAKGVWGDTHS